MAVYRMRLDPRWDTPFGPIRVVEDWLEENTPGYKYDDMTQEEKNRFGITRGCGGWAIMLQFKDESDAALFKLTWY